MREYITPNWHVVLVHAPLGLLSVGIVIELFSFLWRRSSARMAGRWMILLGAVTAVPALTSGLYAYRDALSPVTSVGSLDLTDPWHKWLKESNLAQRANGAAGDKLKEITAEEFLGTEAGKTLWNHLLYNCIGVGVVFLVIVTFIGASDRWRRRLYLPLLLVLLAGEGLVIWGSHSGGLAVYEHAVAIKPPTPASTMVPTTEEKLMVMLPPVQLHLTLAGWVVAMALVALATSIRALTEGAPTTAADEAWYEGQEPKLVPAAPVVNPGIVGPADTVLGTQSPSNTTSSFELAPAVERSAEVQPGVKRTVTTSVTQVVEPIIPVATSRFWLLATLFGIGTFVSGLWIIHNWTWESLVGTLRGENRNMYHSILGTSLLVLTLFLALITRIARRNKTMISVFSLLLFLVIGLQIYVGILLTFDGPKGSKAGLFTPLKLNVVKE